MEALIRERHSWQEFSHLNGPRSLLPLIESMIGIGGTTDEEIRLMIQL